MNGNHVNINGIKPVAIVIAAPKSGSGKTTVALSIMRALRNRGLHVQPYKVGPDYLDGLWHQAACGTASYNLDTWMFDRNVLCNHFCQTLRGHDIGIVEGVMGLYDGYEGSITGTTADLAILLGIPVVLVVDCKGFSGSIAALATGFRDFRKECAFAGVVCNNVASDTHERYLREALCSAGVPLLGCIPRNEHLTLGHRHLGLVAAQGSEADNRILDAMADAISSQLDLDALVSAAGKVALPHEAAAHPPAVQTCRIAVARDKAFHFYYQSTFDALENHGAELVFFSPLNDTHLPDNIHGLYLGGGYPEEHAEQLSNNHSMMHAVKEFSRTGGCIYAECGGYMYLGRYLTKPGTKLPMCGVFDCDFIMADSRRKMLGYREAKTRCDTLLGSAGTVVRGHEFHYSWCKQSPGGDAPFLIKSRSGNTEDPAGSLVSHTLGSYLHIHFLSNPSIAQNFVRACEKRKQRVTSL